MVLRWALVWLGLCLAAGGSAQELPSQWLAKMDHSRHQLNYFGVMTYQYADQLRSFRISHLVRDGQEFHRLETLDGPNWRLVTQGRGATGLSEESRALIPSSVASQTPPSQTPPSEPTTLTPRTADVDFQRYYDIDLVGEDRVAERPVVELKVTPKDVYRLGYLLSLDRDTGLLLRSAVLDQQGRVLERMQYTLINFSEPSFAPEAQSAALTVDAGLPAATPSQWHPNWLPAGFNLTKDRSTLDAKSYSDGLTVFSVFVQGLEGAWHEGEGGRQLTQRRGASVAYSTILPDRQARITVVGEVPLLTARQVAESLVWVEVTQ